MSVLGFSTLLPGFDSYREVDLSGIRVIDVYIMFYALSVLLTGASMKQMVTFEGRLTKG